MVARRSRRAFDPVCGLQQTSRSMPIYNSTSKVSTEVDLQALLSSAVQAGGQPSTLRDHLGDSTTIVLFVRNGA